MFVNAPALPSVAAARLLSQSWRIAKSSFGQPTMRPTTRTGNGTANAEIKSNVRPSATA